MGIRDEELHKLTLYAQSLGLTVEYKKHQRGDPGATWSVDHVLTLYTWPGQSKLRLILNFLHELGHQMQFIYDNRQHNPKLLLALNMEEEKLKKDKPIPKKMRKLIYEDEVKAAGYREQIYHEVGLSFAIEKLTLDIEEDLYGYEQYYITGTYPTQKQVREYFKQRKGR